MDLQLTGRGVLVTGATGGIGAAIVEAFAAEGAQVAVHCRSDRHRAEELVARFGGCVVQGDLSDPDTAERVVSEAVEGLGRLDVCVANAGAWDPQSVNLWDMSVERFRRVVDDNLTTTFLTCRAFLRHVRTTGVGDVVLVSSTSAIFGEAGNADYAAAKAAIGFGLARTLKNEIVRIAPTGRVNVVAPGWTLTEAAASQLSEEVLPAVTATMPLKKLATPGDVARAVVWLASPFSAGHCSGETITLAGGMEGRLVAGTPLKGTNP